MTIHGTVYHITNLQNGKVYIGQTIHSYHSRCRTHWLALNRHTHYNEYLQAAFMKYGGNNFITGSLYHAVCQDELDAAEDMYIHYYDSLNPVKGYNLCGGGARGGNTPTDVIRQKISASKRGQVTWMKGKTHAPESKVRMSQAASGRIGSRNPFYGKTHSPESIEKNRLAHLGKKQTEESNRKRSESLRRYYEERRNNGVV